MTPAPGAPYRPTSELVGIAWLKLRVPEFASLLADNIDIVGTALPSDTTKWAATGFLQVTAIPGGRPVDIDLPRRLPILQLDAWATANTSGTASSIKPPWHLAAQLIEYVRIATEDAQTGYYGKTIDIKTNYRQARVQAAYLVTEPDKVLDDPSGYAHFTADLAVDWVPA